jgi:hypothetical protein
METLGNYSVANCGKKMAKEYFCEKCDYKCFKKYNWDKHLTTSKHVSETSGNHEEMANGKKWQNTKLYSCQLCPKEFSNRSGLWKHKQKCNQEQKVEQDETKQETTKNEINFDKELIMMLIKQNAELMEIVKNGTHNTTNNNTNTHTNSHNKAFNLNFFLNETCKNAMNITDFVDSIKLQLTDLMEVGELGYVEGISKIIVKNLNNLDETIRPVHCTDKKRETMYIKDQGEWTKEDDNKSKLKKAINKIADKNIRLLPQFREKYPEYNNSASKMSDKYEKMVIEVMETDNDKKEKIIKNISKATTIKDDN